MPDMSKMFSLTVLFSCVVIQIQAQTIRPDLQNLSGLNVINRTVEPVDEGGKKAIRISEAPGEGFAILKGVDFSNGTIEFDVKGKNVVQQSFVGVAFHGVDEKTYDAVYFRPFNFSNPDTARRSRAVQYVSMPDHPWEKLRDAFPGKYENRVDPVPNPDEWFHAKIIVDGKRVAVFVNDAQKPSLEIQKLTGTTKGKLALWVGNNSGGSFANLVITKSAAGGVASAKTEKVAYGNNPEAGRFFNTGEVKLYYEVYGKGDPILMLHGGVYGYISEFEYLIPKLAENHQVICLATRGHGKSEIGHQPFTYKQRAEDAYKLLAHLKINKAAVIGFSDGAYAGYKMAAMFPDAVSELVAMGAGDYDPLRKRSTYSEEGLMKTSAGYFQGLKKLMPEPARWNECLGMLNELYNNDVVSNETFTKIKCPVLVMSGDKDNSSSVDRVVSSFKQIPGAMLSIIPAAAMLSCIAISPQFGRL